MFDTKYDGKLICAFKSDIKKLENFHWLKNSDFIFALESKVVERNQNKSSKTTRFTRCRVKTLFYLGNK